MKYYLTDNATRAYRSGGFEFRFEPTEVRAGAWRGLLATAEKAEQAALAELCAANPAVREIGAEEFEALKKKTPAVPFSPSLRDPSVSRLLPRSVEPVAPEAPLPTELSPATEAPVEVQLAEASPPDELSEEVAAAPTPKKKGKR